jgi:hypothetical protein
MPEEHPFEAMESVLRQFRNAPPAQGAPTEGAFKALVRDLLTALASSADLEAMKTTALPDPDALGSGLLVIRRAGHDRADWVAHRRLIVLIEGGRVARYYTTTGPSGFGIPPAGVFDS